MKKTLIRNGVFETNSSSCHSISIADETKEFILDTLYPNEEGVIILRGGEYGWDWFKHNDAETKANYAAQTLGQHSVLIDVIKEQTGAVEVIIDTEDGYIDHESYGLIPTIKEDLRSFIFNKNSWLFGGNDNSTADPTFYIVPEYKDGKIIEPKYKYEIKVEGYEKTTKFLSYPDNENISDALESLLDYVYLSDVDGTNVFDDDNSIAARINRNSGQLFEFSSWKKPIDFENNIIYFIRDPWNSAVAKYRHDPKSETEDWGTIGIKKVRDIEKELLNSPDFVKAVKFSINEI